MSSSGTAIQKCRNCDRSVVAGLDFCSLCLLTPVMQDATSGFSQSSSLTGQRIHGFWIEEILGAGGFADVYSARRDSETTSDSLPAESAASHTRSQRGFAVKVLRKGISAADTIARFEVERRLLEQFTHESIVRVFESGLTDDHRPYFVMEQIDGLPITEFCRVERLSLHQRLELFSKVCDAVYHAHSKGIIHRDLKPSNVLVRSDQGVASPKVIDFGIAKAIETPDWGTVPVTQVNMVFGTPAYISPEQAEGSDNADTRSDIYSLGVLLYEVVTDQPAWSQDQWRKLPSIQWSRFLRENKPPMPSLILQQDSRTVDLAKQVRGDIDQIIRKAMSANPSDRYASAFGLAADIRRWLGGRPVVARPLSPFEQLKRYVNAHRWQAGTLLVSLAGIVAIGLLGTILSFTMRESNKVLQVERNKAIESERLERIARADAIAEKTLAEHQRYASEVRLSEVYLQNEEPFLAAERLRRTQADLRGWEYNYLTELSKRFQSACDFDLTDAITFGSDRLGRWVAVASKSRWQLANLEIDQRLPTVVEDGSIVQIAVRASVDRIFVAVLTNNGPKTSIRVYSIELEQEHNPDAKARFLWENSAAADGCWIQWHEDQNGVYLVTVHGNGPEPSPSQLRVFDALSGNTVKDRECLRFKVANKGTECEPGFPWIVVRRSFDSLEVLAWPGLTLARTIDLEENSLIADFLIDAEGMRILFSSFDEVYECRINAEGQISEPAMESDALTDELINRLNLIPPSVEDSVSQDQSHQKTWVAITDRSQAAEAATSPNHLTTRQEISQVSLKNGSYVSLLSEGRVEIRSDLPPVNSPDSSDLKIPVDPVAKEGHVGEGRRVCIAPDSTYCIFQEWHRASFLRVSLTNQQDKPTTATFTSAPQPDLEWTLLPVVHPDGSVLACVEGKLKSLRLDSSPSASEPHASVHDVSAVEWNIDGKSVWSAAFSADGSRVFIGAKDGVSCYDWKSQKLIHQWPVEGGPFHVMASSDDDTCFALRGDHTLFRLGKNPSHGVIVGNRPGPTPTLATFCQAKQQLAIGVADGVDLLQLSLDDEPKLICKFDCPEGASAIAMDEQGQRIAIASSNRRLTVWDVSYQLELVTLPIRAHCSSMAFSADNRFLINTDYSPSLSVHGQ